MPQPDTIPPIASNFVFAIPDEAYDEPIRYVPLYVNHVTGCMTTWYTELLSSGFSPTGAVEFVLN